MNDSLSENESGIKGFNKFQSIFWPIHGYEMKKFLPIGLLMFCLLFVHAMVRDLKDVFILKYAICGGTELIPVLKLVFIMPITFLTVILFAYLVDKFGSTKTFYIFVTAFLSFYAIFIIFLFPNVEYLHADTETVRDWQNSAPKFLYYVIPCLTNWVYSLFYICAEIWGKVAISSLFWQFANRITKKNEVTRFFGVYALMGNLGTAASGVTLFQMSRADGEVFNTNVKILISLAIFFGICSVALYYYINNVIMKDIRFYNPDDVEFPENNKKKHSVIDGLKLLFTSKYLLLIFVVVISYFISMNFIEIILKEQMRVTFPNRAGYSQMQASLTIATSSCTIILTVISSNILRKFSWTVGAAITPFTMLILGGLFFGLNFYQSTNKTILFDTPITLLICWVGLIIQALSKSMRYCLFDPNRNLAYLPLDEDTKTKGQAAVEIIGSGAGKASSSSIQYVLTNIVDVGSKISSHLSVITAIFGVTAIAWICSIFKLGKKYEEKNLA